MDRTYTMIRTARGFLKTLKPTQKIFLIAGSEHLSNAEGYSIVNSMHSEKVALLIPKDLYSTESDLAYAKKLLEG